MLAQKSPIQVIDRAGIEARIYRVQQGYRVEVNGTETEFYWHPGIFRNLQELFVWLTLQLEKLEDGLPLGGDWLMLEGDFDGNEIYRDWFISEAPNWQGYDPLTNCCHTAPTLKALKAKIDRIENERSPHSRQLQ
jgi:hypothetical protein